MIEKRWVLPPPLGPINAVIRRAEADSEAPLTAIKPPKPRETPSTERSGSAMRCSLRGFPRGNKAARQTFPCVHKRTDKPLRRKRDDQYEHGAKRHQVETGDVPRKEFSAFADRFDHQRTDQ